MKSVLLSLVSLFVTVNAFAADFGFEAGIRQQSGSVVADTQTAKSQMGYQIGLVGFLPVAESFGVRTGFFYVSRPLEIDNDATVNSGSSKIYFSSFDVPVTLAYKFEDYASIFGGGVLSINLDSRADGSGDLASAKVQDVKTPIVPILIGASFKFAPQLGGTVFFESYGGDVARNLKDYKAVGVNLLVTFE